MFGQAAQAPDVEAGSGSRDQGASCGKQTKKHKGYVPDDSLSDSAYVCKQTDPMTPLWFENDTWLKMRNAYGSTEKVTNCYMQNVNMFYCWCHQLLDLICHHFPG